MNTQNLIDRLRGIVKRNATEYISDRKEAADALEELAEQLETVAAQRNFSNRIIEELQDKLAEKDAEIERLKSMLNDNSTLLLAEKGRHKVELENETDHLRGQLAEKDVEIEHLKQSRENFAAHAEKTLEQLAASQAVNQKLREAMQHYMDHGVTESSYYVIRKALSLPNDTTSLNEYSKRVAEKVKEMCADFVPPQYYQFGDAIRALDVSKVLEEE